ncbi:MAG TPA: Ldh family oxidoreductase [Arenibacter sp.]|nr:Ldh family oxidoreductase [Arenibacter sp.]
MKNIQYIDSLSFSEWSKASLIKMGVSDKDASTIVNCLVQTSLWGIDSHGIARFPHYLSRIKAGSLNPAPQLKIENTGPCSSNMDGDHGLGIVVMDAATREAIALARKNGVGVVGVRDSSHCGAIGVYGRMIAESGLIGIVFTHSDAFVAPHGGYKKFVGTNPICISVPNKGGRPVCLDMATSAIAWNKVMNARNDNDIIPPDVAYDADGNPTEDPNLVDCLRPMAEHKGYAMAFMIDLLCGPLNGMPWGINISEMYGDLTQKRHLGSLVIAIDPARFFGGDHFSETVSIMANSARNQPVKNIDIPVEIPGDDHYRNEKKRMQDGIPVESVLLDQINSWSVELGVRFTNEL